MDFGNYNCNYDCFCNVLSMEINVLVRCICEITFVTQKYGSEVSVISDVSTGAQTGGVGVGCSSYVNKIGERPNGPLPLDRHWSPFPLGRILRLFFAALSSPIFVFHREERGLIFQESGWSSSNRLKE